MSGLIFSSTIFGSVLFSGFFFCFAFLTLLLFSSAASYRVFLSMEEVDDYNMEEGLEPLALIYFLEALESLKLIIFGFLELSLIFT
jgi:hypothetical protein